MKKEYPLTYEECKNKLIESFIENDWDYPIKFTKKQKQEFIDNTNFDFRESYQEECRNYDNGRPNIFNDEEGIYYINGLLFDCDMYYSSMEASEKASKKGNNKYPLSYDEFKDKVVQLYIRTAHRRWNDTEEVARNDLKNYFKEYDTSELKGDYMDCCEWYDKSLKGETSMPPENVFQDKHLSSTYVTPIIEYMNFFG